MRLIPQNNSISLWRARDAMSGVGRWTVGQSVEDRSWNQRWRNNLIRLILNTGIMIVDNEIG